MRILLAQLDAWVGDCSRNGERILAAVAAGQRIGADLVLTPELSLCGYPAEDWLFRRDFLEHCREQLTSLAQAISGKTKVVVGFPEYEQGLDGKERVFNAAAVICQQAIIGIYRKQELPNRGVFDDKRYFTAGNSALVFPCSGKKVGLLVCEDIWHPGPAQQAKAAGADILAVINASPYHDAQPALRHQVLQARARENYLPILYCNRAGGQDELVFDGASMVVDPQGVCIQRLPSFSEALVEVTSAIFKRENSTSSMTIKPVKNAVLPLEAQLYAALVLGLRAYVVKNGFKRLLLGLSGGVDSALTLAIAVDACGSAAVQAVMLPSRYNAAMSLEDAQILAKNLNVSYTSIPIDSLLKGYQTALAPVLGDHFQGLTEENLQARIRGVLLMAISNQTGALLLNTSNKSEMAMGYGTLYGDMAGGFAVLKDLYKTRVYALARYRNQLGRVIPERVFTRAPSAELRENQTDQDTLPDYAVLDAILCSYLEAGKGSAEIVREGYASDLVAAIIQAVHRNEYKRRQAAVGSRITARAFGKDWRYPMTTKISCPQIEERGKP